ncbi:MAG TPA: prolipoprotein diacylglyceryl transferase family protein [Thermoanaerobaculia bacterium]|nr:prolipoprotein diacylglyceryl transferase family protein [Thermoanaerobaculia bacterium]
MPPDWTLSLHGLFVLLGTVAAVAVFLAEARRRRVMDDRLFAVLVGGLLCGAVAARLGVLGRYLALDPDPSLPGLLLRGGQSVLGGLAGAYAGVLLTKRLVGYRESTDDVFVPGVALGLAVGRVGCFLTEPPGRPTGLPWGVVAKEPIPGLPAAWVGVPLHPSYAYEIAFHALAFVALLRLRSHPRLRSGDLFKLYLLGYALFRFSVELTRANPVVWLGLTGSQLFLIPSTLLLAGSLAWRRRSWRHAMAETADA